MCAIQGEISLNIALLNPMMFENGIKDAHGQVQALVYSFFCLAVPLRPNNPDGHAKHRQ